MTTHDRNAAGPGTVRRLMTLAAGLALAAGVAGCDSLLDVENPNNVGQDDLENATAVNAIVNGALSETSDALSTALLASMTFSDEYRWVGSQNNLGALDRGELDNDANSYSPFLALVESRWLADEAIDIAVSFEGETNFPNDVARAYLYSGVNYVTIADLFRDFTFSDRMEEAPPVGEANMHTVYDMAIERFNAAITEAQQVGASEIELQARAMLARAEWAQSLWHKLHPSVAADPWINDPEANAAAQAVLDAIAGVNPDWRFTFEYTNATVTNDAASNANSRLEVRVHERFALPTASDKKTEAVTYPDILDTDVVAPELERRILAFIDGFQFSPLIVTSAREMHLILAEAGLASGNDAQAIEHINAIRAMDGLTLYDPAVHEPTVAEMLKHARLINTFLMVQRRWADMYRFGEATEEWVPDAEARVAPGTFFQIHQDEKLSNCYILGTC